MCLIFVFVDAVTAAAAVTRGWTTDIWVTVGAVIVFIRQR